ncbi:MAG: hypothetical protein KDC93_01890 [Cyclobacteriaceae bacterium]|nr:hypothetical protein [Cyclobacteriaceae bacterium]
MKMRLYLVVLFVVAFIQSYAQQADSLKVLSRADSITTLQLQEADSIQQAFQHGANEITEEYQKVTAPIDSTQQVLKNKIDSLNSLSLPTHKLSAKLDSLQQLKGNQLTAANGKLDKLKSKTTQGMEEVTLPPQMQQPVDQFKQSVNGYSISDSKSGMPAMDMPGLDIKGGLDIPSSGLGELNLNGTGELGKVTESIAGYGGDVQQIAKGNVGEVKNIDKAAEAQAMKLADTGELQENAATLNQMHEAGASMNVPEALKKQASEELKKQALEAMMQNPATDYFADKTEVLQGAMGKMSKVKSKYTDVKSLFEMPKRPPNPMKDKPFIERIIPFLTFQIQSSDYFLLDVNPGLMYRVSGRFSAVAGWNHRLAFEDLNIHKEERVYGPRAGVQFKWVKGVSLRFLPEVMNSYVPSRINNFNVEEGSRQWVWSWPIGIKKEFKVYKSIRGNTEMMYNLYDRKDKSPYGDKIHVRFGFEFPMKKKVKEPKS